MLAAVCCRLLPRCPRRGSSCVSALRGSVWHAPAGCRSRRRRRPSCAQPLRSAGLSRGYAPCRAHRLLLLSPGLWPVFEPTTRDPRRPPCLLLGQRELIRLKNGKAGRSGAAGVTAGDLRPPGGLLFIAMPPRPAPSHRGRHTFFSGAFMRRLFLCESRSPTPPRPAPPPRPENIRRYSVQHRATAACVRERGWDGDAAQPQTAATPRLPPLVPLIIKGGANERLSKEAGKPFSTKLSSPPPASCE